jgi:hypothetical protein
MTTYTTKYSNLTELTKKERKQKSTQFPFTPVSSNIASTDLCGQKVNKLDLGNNMKFCPLCDQPMIVKIFIHPCEHVICYSCSEPATDICYV